MLASRTLVVLQALVFLTSNADTLLQDGLQLFIYEGIRPTPEENPHGFPAISKPIFDVLVERQLADYLMGTNLGVIKPEVLNEIQHEVHNPLNEVESLQHRILQAMTKLTQYNADKQNGKK